MSENANIVAYREGVRLVAMEDRDVRTYVVHVDGEESSVFESINRDEPTVLFKGTADEAARVLRGLHASYAGTKVEQSNHRRVFATATAVVLLTGIIGVGIGEYVRRGPPTIEAARVGAAPDRIASNDPEDEAFTAAGNDDKTGSVSPHGSTGATVAPAMTRPGGTSPAGKPPSLPPVPPATAASLVGDPKSIRKADAAPPKAGLAARAADAAVKSEDDVKAAKETVAKSGTAPAEKELADLKAALAGLGQEDKLPPEVVRTLPHDLAKQLVDAGVVETAEETSARLSGKGPKKFSIVHLPPAVADAYRDHDNVPTIPEENSWIATGGNVVIPLPGGGEIRKPTDLALFHLKG